MSERPYISPGYNPTLTRLADLEGRVERLEQEREMSETTETVTLHERLREAADETSSGTFISTTFFGLKHADLAAIEEAIEAPWRERVAELEMALLADTEAFAREHDALKARADAQEGIVKAGKSLWSAAMGALVILRDLHPETQSLETVKDLWELAGAFEAIAYDAADRAGETPTPDQVRALDGLAEDAIRAYHAGETTNIHDLAAPSPADAAAEGEPLKYDPELAIDGLFPYIEDFDDRIRKLEDANIDLERWRADVDERMETDRRNRLRVLNQYANDTINRFAKNELRIANLEQRLDAPSPDPESADWKDGWQAGHEAGYRSGRGEEVAG